MFWNLVLLSLPNDNVCLISTGNPIPGNLEFHLASNENMEEQVKKKSSHVGLSLMIIKCLSHWYDVSRKYE